MSDRPYNFSAGPAILPGEVFERCSAAVKQLNTRQGQALVRGILGSLFKGR